MTDSLQRSGASVAYEWWRNLNPTETPQSGPHRAALARMRRAATPVEVMQEPGALRLVTRLPRNPDRVAALAGILAHVRESDHRSVARAVGRTALDEDRTALLSEGRFRRLLQTPGGELMEPMRRLVRMMKGTVNVPDLASAVLYWGDDVRKRWIFDYYAVSAGLRPADDENGSPEPRQQEG